MASRFLPRTVASAVLLLTVSLFLPVARAAADEPGTTGVNVAQLFADDQPNKRGVLVVVVVRDNSAAADAGIQQGDIITKINGTDVRGRELNEIIKAGLRGSVGQVVRFTVQRPSDGSVKEIALTHRPYPVMNNPRGDAFEYSWPGSWRSERYQFPLPWSPDISYKGLEDLLFAPNFDDREGPQYHSYIFLWWLEGKVDLPPAKLRKDLIEYFRGLTGEREKSYHFTADLDKVSATMVRMPGGGDSAKQHYSGDVSIYGTFGKVIVLHADVTLSYCAEANHTLVFFDMSPQPREAAIWPQMEKIRDTFRCKRS